MGAEQSRETPEASSKVYSFDVFDTCITRTYAFPRDLFYDLGLQLAPSGLSSAEKKDFARTFQARRVRAEQRANRLTGPHVSADIYSIYELFDPPNGLALDIEGLVQAEVALERESIYLVGEIASLIEELRRHGHRIVFISDMYLPARLLAPILKERGVLRDGDVLYVSCDAGRTKHTGELFQHVLENEGTRASEFSHTGDNAWADVRMAASAGIRTTHFTETHLTPHEARMAGRGLPWSRGGSFLAGLSRRSRLETYRHIGSDKHPLDPVIHSTIVPFLLAYVSWVLEQAERTDVRRLYFVARDGQVLYRIAQELIGEKSSIDLRYLYGSRHAWLSPSITPDTSELKSLLVTGGHSNSRRDILSRAGLDDSEQVEFRALFDCSLEQWSTPLPFAEANAFVEGFLAHNVAMRIVYAASAERREMALGYFEQEGLLDDVPWALVDTGWALNSQAALRRILHASGRMHQVPRGFYIALEPSHLPHELAGPAWSFIPIARSIFCRRRFVIEHAFTPSMHATTRGYEAGERGVVPIYGTELRGRAELDYAARLHQVALAAAQLAGRDENIASSLKTHAAEIIENAEQFLRRPRPEDARAMASFGTIADLRHERAFVTPLCRPLRLPDIGRLLLMNFSRHRRENLTHLTWLEGSIAVSPLFVRALLTGMLWLKSILGYMFRRA